jgi:WD40 repeat protein
VPRDVKFTVVDETWDACIRRIRSQSMPAVYGAAFSHKDNLVAVGGFNAVEIFEAATGKPRATLMTNYIVWSLVFSPDDTIIATARITEFDVLYDTDLASAEGKIDVWDLQTGGLMGTLKGHNKEINSMEFSPCGNMIATCSADHTIRIWNTIANVSWRTIRAVESGSFVGRLLEVKSCLDLWIKQLKCGAFLTCGVHQSSPYILVAQ